VKSIIATAGAAIVAFSVAGSTSAQTASVGPAPAVMAGGPACELHVFPTTEGQAMTTGWLSGFGIVGAVADAAKNKNRNVSEAEYLKEALGPKMQVDALKSIDMVSALKLPPSRIVYETPISDRKVTTKAGGRLSTSAAPCYAELIVTQNFYTKRPMYGRSLNNRFIFKDFRGGKTDAKLIKGRGGNGLTAFPQRPPTRPTPPNRICAPPSPRTSSSSPRA
jgi:hypothetical protein